MDGLPFHPTADVILDAHSNGLMSTYLSDRSHIFSPDIFSAISPSIHNLQQRLVPPSHYS
jgi:hypothetical protein